MSNKEVAVFTPYYINQNRLFDLYSILHKGFVEYEEITSSSGANTKGVAKADTAVSGGFGLFKISGGIKAGIEQANDETSATSTRKVQTVASILGEVLATMSERKHFAELSKVCEGGFINHTVNFSLNSIKKLLEMIKDVIGLSPSLKSLNVNLATMPYNAKQIDDIIKMFRFMFGGLEVFYETDSYALIANINEDNLYLSILDDILDTDIKCFAQVKKIHNEGTALLKNTMFSKIKGDKSSFIDSIAGISDNDSYDFGVTARSEIEGKPVYEVEILSLSK